MGEYTLVTYRIARQDAGGVEWFISATAPSLRQVVVRAGKEEVVKVEETVRVRCGTSPKGDETVVQAGISGEGGCGLSIYRNGKRVAMGYRIEDAGGKKLASGVMEYG